MKLLLRPILLFLLTIPQSHAGVINSFVQSGTELYESNFIYDCKQISSQIRYTKIDDMTIAFDPQTKFLIWEIDIDIPNARLTNFPYFYIKKFENHIGPFGSKSILTQPATSKFSQEDFWKMFLRNIDTFADSTPYNNEFSKTGILEDDPKEFYPNSYVYQTTSSDFEEFGARTKMLEQTKKIQYFIDFNFTLATQKQPIDQGQSIVIVQFYFQLLHPLLMASVDGEQQNMPWVSNYFEMKCVRSNQGEDVLEVVPSVVRDNVIRIDEWTKKNKTLRDISFVQSAWLDWSRPEKREVELEHQKRLALIAVVGSSAVLYKILNKAIKPAPYLGALVGIASLATTLKMTPSGCISPNLFANMQNMPVNEFAVCLESSAELGAEFNILKEQVLTY